VCCSVEIGPFPSRSGGRNAGEKWCMNEEQGLGGRADAETNVAGAQREPIQVWMRRWAKPRRTARDSSCFIERHAGATETVALAVDALPSALGQMH
jgi:hypothetical protein